VTTPGDLSDRR